MVDLNAEDVPPEEPAAIGFPVCSSVDKLHTVAGELGALEPEDAMQAALLTMLSAFAPALTAQLPDDPDELDELLLAGARWMLNLRSDDAWTPETIDELYLGEHPDASPVDAVDAGGRDA
ncbi:MAG TPA: hypothetical protein VMY78_09955 [Solirubrobacteraceae bacterium]|nr:hypothetical protein [Solirubrobacteraceae bacterium]